MTDAILQHQLETSNEYEIPKKYQDRMDRDLPLWSIVMIAVLLIIVVAYLVIHYGRPVK